MVLKFRAFPNGWVVGVGRVRLRDWREWLQSFVIFPADEPSNAEWLCDRFGNRIEAGASLARALYKEVAALAPPTPPVDRSRIRSATQQLKAAGVRVEGGRLHVPASFRGSASDRRELAAVPLWQRQRDRRRQGRQGRP